MNHFYRGDFFEIFCVNFVISNFFFLINILFLEFIFLHIVGIFQVEHLLCVQNEIRINGLNHYHLFFLCIIMNFVFFLMIQG